MFPKFEISISCQFDGVENECFSLRLFENGDCRFQDLWNDKGITFESNIVYILRFMIDTKVIVSFFLVGRSLTLVQVVGMNWIEVPPGNYTVIPRFEKKSTCQVEISMRYVA